MFLMKRFYWISEKKNEMKNYSTKKKQILYLYVDVKPMNSIHSVNNLLLLIQILILRMCIIKVTYRIFEKFYMSHLEKKWELQNWLKVCLSLMHNEI